MFIYVKSGDKNNYAYHEVDADQTYNGASLADKSGSNIFTAYGLLRNILMNSDATPSTTGFRSWNDVFNAWTINQTHKEGRLIDLFTEMKGTTKFSLRLGEEIDANVAISDTCGYTIQYDGWNLITPSMSRSVQRYKTLPTAMRHNFLFVERNKVHAVNPQCLLENDNVIVIYV